MDNDRMAGMDGDKDEMARIKESNRGVERHVGGD